MLGLVYRGGEVGWRGWVERRCRESEKRGSKKENFCDLILEGKVIWRGNIWREKEGESIKKVFGEEGYERDRERLRKGPQMAELDACVACPRGLTHINIRHRVEIARDLGRWRGV